MSKFDLEKYLPTEKEVVNEEDSPIESPVEKQTKEVKIAKLGESAASEVIAKALIEALRREDIELIQKPDDSSNGIFDNVKIVSTEEINNNLRGVLGDLKETDIIVTDMFLPKTMEEEMFDTTVNETGIKIYNNLDKAAKDLSNLGRNEAKVVEEPTNDLGVDLHQYFPGDKLELMGVMREVIFRDSYVIILREESEQPTCKESYLVLDCPKGV